MINFSTPESEKVPGLTLRPGTTLENDTDQQTAFFETCKAAYEKKLKEIEDGRTRTPKPIR